MDSDLFVKFYGTNTNYSYYLNQMHHLHEQVSLRKIPDQLMLLEHEAVITYTRQHMFKSIKTSKEEVQNSGINLCLADRGGDITFHGPGQLIGYPLFYLPKKNVVDFVRKLEAALLEACFFLGINNAHAIPGLTGVFVDNKKIVSIGIGFQKKTTKHGFAFNLSIDQEPFLQHIIPCGLTKTGITTLKSELNKQGLEMPNYLDILAIVTKCIAKAFNRSYKEEFFHG